MTEVELLKAARELIADPAHWVTGYLAVDEYGNPVTTSSQEACKFCAMGAVYHTEFWAYSTLRHSALERLDEISSEMLSTKAGDADIDLADMDEMRAVALVNDYLGHTAVLEVFDQAIAQAEQEGA